MVPATALGIGVIVKYILNLILIKNPSIGVYGAGIASLCCNVVVFLIGITVLIKNMKLQLDLGKFMIKPILSTGMMAIVSLYVYNVLQKLIANQLATVISIACAGIIYIISLLILRNLTKEEIYKMPQGDKIVKALQILRLSK